MKISYLTYGAVALISGSIVAATGCTSTNITDDGGDGGAGGGTTVGPGPGPGPGAGGSGGGSGDGNDSFEEAVTISEGTDQFGTLEPAATDEDYYKFMAQAGDLIFIDSAAKPDPSMGNAFDPAYPDTVLTLYNSSQTQVAQNDDPYLSRTTNDAQIWYLVPTTGEYFIRITDCLNVFGAESCSDAANIVNHDYGLRLSFIDPADPGVVQDSEGGNDKDTNPNAMEFEPNTDTGFAGDFFATVNYGTFADAGDIDVYSFLVPGAAAVEDPLTTDLFGAIFIQGPEGPDGIGTTNNIGDAWIENDAGQVIARINHSLGIDAEARDLRAPMAAGGQYWLFVQHPDTAAGAHDYYIFNSNMVETNPLEAEGAGVEGASGNDGGGVGTPEPVTLMANGTLQSAFLAGNISPTVGGDDSFIITVPTGFTGTFTAVCGAHRSGSGLRNLTIDVRSGDDSTSIMTSAAEDEDEDLILDEVDLGSETSIVVSISSGMADGDIAASSRFWQCGFHFVPPAPGT